MDFSLRYSMFFENFQRRLHGFLLSILLTAVHPCLAQVECLDSIGNGHSKKSTNENDRLRDSDLDLDLDYPDMRALYSEVDLYRKGEISKARFLQAIELLKKDSKIASLSKDDFEDLINIIVELGPQISTRYILFQRILRSRNVKLSDRPTSFAKLALKEGVLAFEHRTTADKIFQILASGLLMPQDQTKIDGIGSSLLPVDARQTRYVYLQAKSEKGLQHYSSLLTTAVILFPVEVADKFPWSYAHLGWHRGSTITSSVNPSYLFELYVHDVGRAKEMVTNEILFSFIDLKKIDFKVFLDSDKREKLLKQLSISGIAPPNSRGWDEIIISEYQP